MCWMCDHPEATVEDSLDNVRGIIRSHGWAIQYVEVDRAPFAYTVGLHALGLPELLVTGVEPETAAALLNQMARNALCDGPPRVGAQMRVNDVGPLVEIVEVTHPDAHMGYAIAIEGPDITARQVVWADVHGRWPWGRGPPSPRRDSAK